MIFAVRSKKTDEGVGAANTLLVISNGALCAFVCL